ncbi:MAG: Trk system potassium transporter TrkA [Lachnospiraceae bacterium]|nr:Trk system potassium transporter TrkA [Lachnospiraceae bacterium]
MKIVIIGDGKVGHKIATELSDENYDVVLIDQNQEQLANSSNTLDVLCIPGDGADVEVLRAADVQHADLAIACTSSDELNMLSCLFARRLGARHTIARVRNPIYFQQISILKEDLRLSMSVNPEMEAADEILRILSFSAATKVENFVKGEVELVEYPLKEGSSLDGLALKNLYTKYQIKILICAVQRGSDVIIPDGDFVLRAGDKINIIAGHAELEQFFDAIGQTTTRIRKVLIVGGGHLGYYLASQLIKSKMQVKIIEADYEKCLNLSESLPEATIIHGNARDHALLQEEGIQDADAIVTLTGSDELNMLTAVYGKMQGINKIIAKVNEESLSDMVASVGINSVVSPKEMTADRILSYVRARQNSLGSANVEAMYHLVNGQIEAMEFLIRADAKYIGIPLKDLPIKPNNLIAAIVRGRKVTIPGGNDMIRPGDSVVIVTMNKKVQKMEDILSDTLFPRSSVNGKGARN